MERSTTSSSAALTGILSTCRKHGYHPTPTRRSSPTDLRLPAPPPIDSSLSSLGLNPVLVVKLSRAYERHVSQLRAASEANFQVMVSTCADINSKFGVSEYNILPLRIAVTQFYTRSFRRMASEALHSVSHYVSLHVQTTAPPGVILQPPQLPCTAFLATPAPNHCISIRYGQTLGTEKAALRLPVWKRDVDENHRNDTLSDECQSYAFPMRYTHAPAAQTSTQPLPSSSDQFSMPARARLRPTSSYRGPSQGAVVPQFKALCIESPGTETKKTNRKSMHPMFGLPFMEGDSRTSRSCSVASKPHKNLASKAFTTARARKISPPVREPSPIQEPRSTSLSYPTRPTPSLAIPSSSSLSIATRPFSFDLTCVTPLRPTNSKAPPVPPTRKRKLASLPRRHPSSTLLSGGRSCGPSSTSVDRNALLPVRLTSAMSRTPSLLSLASVRSDSPPTSDDGIETPPSSPIPCPHGLPTTIWSSEHSPPLFSKDHSSRGPPLFQPQPEQWVSVHPQAEGNFNPPVKQEQHFSSYF